MRGCNAQCRPADDLEADLFDCLEVNLAIVADGYHGAGTGLALGAVLDHEMREGPHGLPTIERSLGSQLWRAETAIGVIATSHRRVPLVGLADAVPPGATAYVVADAFVLPWLPYYGRVHLPHSFLAERVPGGWHIIDGYDNRTRWGAATPGCWRLSELDRGDRSACDVLTLTAAPLAAVEPACVIDGADVGTYVAAYAGRAEQAITWKQLATETWLLSRARRLHMRARARVEWQATPSETEHMNAWADLAGQAYLASRRAQQGKPVPSGILAKLEALLGEDQRLFQPPRDVRTTVCRIVGDLLSAQSAPLEDSVALRSLPGFSSIRLVEVIDAIEATFGLELTASDLEPEHLQRVGDLHRVVEARRAVGDGKQCRP